MKTRTTTSATASKFLRLSMFFFCCMGCCPLHSQQAVTAQDWGAQPIVYLDSTEGNAMTNTGTTPLARALRNSAPHFTLAAPYASLEDFMKKAMRFPDEERIRCTSVMVKVQFDILPSGEIANVAVILSPSPAFSQEALRMVAEMPQWEPAYRDGVPVKVRQQVNIRFALR